LREQRGAGQVLAALGRREYFGEMALFADGKRNTTVRARTAMDVLTIAKADFNKLRQSVLAFGNVFGELAKRRETARSPLPELGVPRE
jgi:CRP-like cAMP-binding protein